MNDFVTYIIALKLKDLGFDGECFGAYNINSEFERATSDYWDNDSIKMINEYTTSDLEVLAPTYQQVFRWFRLTHGLYTSIIPKKSWPDDYVNGLEWHVNICGGDGKEIGPDGVFSYKEAEIEAVKKLIEIVKTK